MINIFKIKYFRTTFFITLLVMVIIFVISSSPISFAQQEVKVFINQVAQQLINTVQNSENSMEVKRSKVKTIIEENFDIEWMSRFVMGGSYKKLSGSQKKKYKSLYLNYLLNNYFPILVKYDKDNSYEILTVQKIDEKDYDVKIKLMTGDSQASIMLKYRIRNKNTEYKCLDMVVEGVSTLISQRAEFKSVIQQSGVDSFLKQLETKQDSKNKSKG